MKNKNIIIRVSGEDLEVINAIKMRTSIYNTSELTLSLFNMAIQMIKNGEGDKLTNYLNICRRNKFVEK